MGLVVCQVVPGSLAERIGIESGDEIIGVDGESIEDTISLSFHTSESEFLLEVRKKDGEIVQLEAEREFGEHLGLDFQSPVSRTKTCANRCLFCFVEQNPPGLRQSLKTKDDDYRLAFLHGNFITLTNLTEKDWERIIGQRLSPLYVSIHATEPGVRRRMMGNHRAGRIREQLLKLAEHGIRLHGQIVLCPGINDGAVLEATLGDLAKLGDTVLSVAIVPVGLTGFRDGLPALKAVDKKTARETIHTAEQFQKQILRARGTRWVWPSDEFYLIAEQSIPGYDTYEDFPQYENGVGLAAEFRKEFDEVKGLLPETVCPRTVSIASSVLGQRVISGMVEHLRGIQGLDIRLHAIPNRFFGGMVGVAGLITGSDLVKHLKGESLGDKLFIPAVCLNKGVFLDGMTVEEASALLDVKIVAADGARELAEKVVQGA